MTVPKTTQAVVLQAIVDRLIESIDDQNEATCYLSQWPERPPTMPADFVLTVSAGEGRYDAEAYTGGGQETVFEQSIVIVSIFARRELDEIGHDEQLLIHTTLGLMGKKREVLKALAQWDLRNPSGVRLLIDQIKPLQAEAPGHVDRSAADLAMSFGCDFHWDLT